jgi:hypothetical protein
MDSPAMTAFACGVRDGDMVVVATRGLIDGLDDDELAAVLANAVVHVRNRDTRLLAAATIFMRNMSALQKERGLKFDNPIQILPLVIFPIFLPVILLVGFWIQVAYRIAYGSRALIGISRELIADAESVRLTHNPAALASALRKIDARSALGDFADEHAAMLVVGVTHGPLATHPTLDERLGALARTTGSMVLDQSPRLDTRLPEMRAAWAGAGATDPALERIALLRNDAPQRGFWGAFRSVRDPERNALGLTRKGMVLLILSICGIALLYRETLRQPDPMPKLFALQQLTEFSGIGATAARCSLAFNASDAEKERCEKSAAGGWRLFDHLPGFPKTKDGRPVEMLTFRESELRRAKEQIARGCFPGRWDGFASSGRTSPTPLEAFIRFGEERAPDVSAIPRGPALDKALIDYAEHRLLMIDNVLHFFGPEGFAQFTQAVDNDAHGALIRKLEQRMAEPRFVGAANPAYVLLVRDPLTVKPCWAHRAMKGMA